MTNPAAHSEDLTFATGEVTLAGTLTLPPDPKGIVVFAHGSGPMDRNQNAGRQRLDIFNTLAEALGAAGYASLRYDKRGCGASTGDYKRHSYAQLTADLCAAVAEAAAHAPGPVWICGHSEGTILAPQAARMTQVAGTIQLCPFVTNGVDILRWQAAEGDKALAEMPGLGGRIARGITGLFGGTSRIQARIIAKVLATDADVIWLMGRRQGVRWLRDFMTLDAAAIHRANAKPTLLIVAGKDVQCPPDDGARIKALCPQADLVRIDDLTHLLRRSDDPPGLAHYAKQLHEPMSGEVAAVMLEWLAAQPASADSG